MRPRFFGTRAICRTNALALPGCIRNIRQDPDEPTDPGFGDRGVAQLPQSHREQSAAALRDKIVK
jgi:hypothetical protein